MKLAIFTIVFSFALAAGLMCAAEPSINILSIQFTAGTSASPTDSFIASEVSKISVIVDYSAFDLLPKDLLIIGVEARNSKGTLVAQNSATVKSPTGNQQYLFTDLIKLSQFTSDDRIKVQVTLLLGQKMKRMTAEFSVEGRDLPDVRIHKIVCLPDRYDEILRGEQFTIGIVYEIRDTVPGDQAKLRLASLVDDPSLRIEDFHLRAPYWDELKVPGSPGWYSLTIKVQAPNFFDQYNRVVHKLYLFFMVDFSESNMKGREKTDRQFFADASADLIDEFPGEPHYSSNPTYLYPELQHPRDWKLVAVDRDKAWEIIDKYEDELRNVRRRGRFDRR